jgi:hypothetical protein
MKTPLFCLNCLTFRVYYILPICTTTHLSSETVQLEKKQASTQSDRQTRAQRAHWRLNWNERLVCNARSSSVPPLAITLHGLPATFAQFFGFALVTAV